MFNLEDYLFPQGRTVTRSQEEISFLFEQYKLLLQTSESLITRRQTVNTFFLSINTLILGAIGLFIKGVVDKCNDTTIFFGGLAIIVLAVTGIILCYAWRSLLISFGTLNAGKFDVINTMEKYFASCIFTAEWEALKEKKYKSFTQTEAFIPIIFGIVHVVALIIGILLFQGTIKIS